MPLTIELYCDHPDCARVNRMLKKAPDIPQAHKLIMLGDVRCPVHGVRVDPVMLGRRDDSGSEL